MRKIVTFISFLTVLCFSSTVFAADAPKAAPVKPAPAKVEAAKPAAAEVNQQSMNREVLIGKIVSIDKTKGEIVVKDKNGQKTIMVKPADIAKLKQGDDVKIALMPGTNNAVKVRPLKTVKRSTNKPAKKAP